VTQRKLLSKQVTDTNWQQLLQVLPPVNVHTGAFIAGGSARKLWCNQAWQSGDVDVFFTSAVHMHAWRTQFTESLCVKSGDFDLFEIDLFDTLKRKWPSKFVKGQQYNAYLHMETENAATYHVQKRNCDHVYKVQLIKVRYAPTLEELWRDFDFTVCCFAADANQIVCLPDSQAHVQERKLVSQITGSSKNRPLRVLKHMTQGFTPDVKLVMEVADQIAQGDFEWQTDY
jgi:hypothetical protein